MRKKSPKSDTLAEWRKTNFAETQKCLEVAKSIRDDPEATNKDRIESIKAIARMLGSLAPERIATTRGTVGDENKELTQDEASLMDTLLNDINTTQ